MTGLSNHHSRPRLSVVIPTAGGCQRLPGTLASLAECELPTNYLCTYVVENGAPKSAKEVAFSAPKHLNVQYLHVERANKSNALNQVFQRFDDDELILLTDDDIRFAPQVLLEYANAVSDQTGGVVFGGPLRIDSDAEPPAAWRGFLPGSLKGWEPTMDRFDPQRHFFLGANWAVFAGDVKRIGGFDPRFGPGSPLNATGQEWNMQSRLRDNQAQFIYLPNAPVWHYVEYDRYDEEFLYCRKYRGGLEAGIIWADRMKNPRLRDLLFHPVTAARARWLACSLAAKTSGLLGCRTTHLRLKMEAEHARGLLFSYPRAHQSN